MSQPLLRALADGETHAAEDLERALGCSGAELTRLVDELGAVGLAVDGAPDGGYRLAGGLDLIDAAELRAALDPAVAARLARLEVHTTIDSTNRRLLEKPPPAGKLDVCIAEFQTAGRGRRGRRWTVPLAAGICLSAAWRFAELPADAAALSLAVGVAARRALARAAGVAIELKWPNDLVLDARKLGGILVESTGEGAQVVVGVGVNVRLPPELLPALCDWPRGAIDLQTALRAPPPRRGLLAAALVDELARVFADYPVRGFGAYRDEWLAADFLRGREVRLDAAAAPLHGTAVGIDAGGALLVATAGGEHRRVVAGDVTVRSSA